MKTSYRTPAQIPGFPPGRYRPWRDRRVRFACALLGIAGVCRIAYFVGGVVPVDEHTPPPTIPFFIELWGLFVCAVGAALGAGALGLAAWALCWLWDQVGGDDGRGGP